MKVIRGYFAESLDWIQLFTDLEGNLAKYLGCYGHHCCKDAELDMQEGVINVRRVPGMLILACSACGFQLSYSNDVSGWVSGIFELNVKDLLFELDCAVFMNICEFCFGLSHLMNSCPHCKATGLDLVDAKTRSILCKVIDVSEYDGEIRVKTREGALVIPTRDYTPSIDEIVIRQEKAESSLVKFLPLDFVKNSKDPVLSRCYAAYESGNGVLPIIEALKARFGDNFYSLVNLDELVEALGYAEINKDAGGGVNGNAADTGNNGEGASGPS